MVFDFGGVLITPITDKIAGLAARHGVTTGELLEVLLGPHESGDHPWHRCERGELAVAEIQQLLDPWAEPFGVSLDGDEIATVLGPGYTIRDEMLDRASALRSAGYRTALLTNTFAEFRPQMERDVDFSRFDVVIESYAVGSRKPEPRIYELTAAAIDATPEEIVYLDDFAQNLEPALALGWQVIHVTGPVQALSELDRLAPL